MNFPFLVSQDHGKLTDCFTQEEVAAISESFWKVAIAVIEMFSDDQTSVSTERHKICLHYCQVKICHYLQVFSKVFSRTASL